MRLRTALTAIPLLGWGAAVSADEITDQIKTAVQAYEGGNYSKAIEELNFAVQQINQKQQGELGKVLPKPLAGWKAEEPESTAFGAAMFGGGATTSKRYTKDGMEVELQILSNSPMLQGVMMMFANPMFMQSEPGSKIDKINGEKAVVKFRDGSGEIQIPLDGKILITLKGSGLADAQPMMDYAKALDFAAIRKLFNP